MLEKLLELLELVAQMRKAQAAYFKNRKSSDLARSKQLEVMVDRRIETLQKRIAEEKAALEKQAALFDDTEH